MWWTIAGVALLAWILWTIVDYARKGSSLLSYKSRETQPPIEHDQAKRDAVLKQNFNPDKIPSNLDAIVIGSGPGGLSAATILSRAGKKVLVVEQHDQAGGTCHTYIEKGYEFDVGVHYLGFFNDPTSIFTIMMNSVTKGRVTFDRIPGVADKVGIGTPGKDYRQYESFGHSLFDTLIEQFPDEREHILEMRKLTYGVYNNYLLLVIVKLLPLWLMSLLVKTGVFNYTMFKYHDVMLVEILDQVGIKNDDLRGCFTYMCSLPATDATTCSFLVFALVTMMYERPSSYPRGGPTEIPYQLIPQIEAAGGKVFVNAMVDEVLFSPSGRAQGVRVGKGNKKCDIYAPAIISDAGLLPTFGKGMIPPHIAQKSRYHKFVESVGPSLSGIQVFIGLEGTPEDLGLPDGNLWYLKHGRTKETYDGDHFNDIDAMMNEEIPWFYSTCSSGKDKDWQNRFPGKSTVQLIFFAPFYKLWEKFEKGTVRHRGQEYNNIKDEIGRNCWDTFCKIYPKCADRVEYFEVGTPLSYNHYLNTTKGEIYAMDHNPNRMNAMSLAELRAKTDIPGLYLTGQDTIVGGIPLAPLSGFIAATDVLGYKFLPVNLVVMATAARFKRWAKSLLGY